MLTWLDRVIDALINNILIKLCVQFQSVSTQLDRKRLFIKLPTAEKSGSTQFQPIKRADEYEMSELRKQN